MQLDELQRELTTLADEIAPFEGDVRALHRRERRRRVAVSSVAAVVVVAIAVGDGRDRAQRRRRQGPRRRRAEQGGVARPDHPHRRDRRSRERRSEGRCSMRHRSVGHYAFVPRGRPTSASGRLTPASQHARCARCRPSDGYAVDARDLRRPTIRPDLGRALAGARDRLRRLRSRFGADAEVFMQVGTVRRSTTRGADRPRSSDPDVAIAAVSSARPTRTRSSRRTSPPSPALVESTKPSDLPESFRVARRSPGVPSTAVARATDLHGVDAHRRRRSTHDSHDAVSALHPGETPGPLREPESPSCAELSRRRDSRQLLVELSAPAERRARKPT